MRDIERRELTIALGPSEGRPDLKVLIDELISGLRPREARPVDSSSPASGDESSGPTSGALMASALPVLFQVREFIELHARREADLEALYDAAQDLTRIRDVERILRAVTERARRLLRCDVAYLSAATEDGHEDFAVRAWSGQLSPQFLGTRVSTGRGLGGEVAASRRPFQVDDYQASADITHTDYLDTQVGAESIVALLGVPLEVDGRLLGFLFAGRRTARRFDDNEVRLLSSLGAHAAVALDNAALFASQLAAFEELGQTNQALREHNAAVETAAEVHAQLTDVLLHGQGVEAIVEVVAEALGVHIAMVDAADVLLAAHGDLTAGARSTSNGGAVVGSGSGSGSIADPRPAIAPPFSANVRGAIAASRQTGRSVETTAPDGTRMYVNTAAAGTTFLGSVLLLTTRQLTDVDVRTFERATQTIAVSLLADAAIAEADQRASSEVMRKLLDVRRSAPEVVNKIARRHLLTGGPVTVVVTDAVATVTADRLGPLVGAASRLCAEHGGLSAVYEDHLVLIQPGEDRLVAQRAWAAMSEVVAVPVTVAAARPTKSRAWCQALHDEHPVQPSACGLRHPAPGRRRMDRGGRAGRVLPGRGFRWPGERLHQPQHDVHDVEPDASGTDARAGRRHPGVRQLAHRLGPGGAVRLRPAAPLSPGLASCRPSARARRRARGVRSG